MNKYLITFVILLLASCTSSDRDFHQNFLSGANRHESIGGHCDYGNTDECVSTALGVFTTGDIVAGVRGAVFFNGRKILQTHYPYPSGSFDFLMSKTKSNRSIVVAGEKSGTPGCDYTSIYFVSVDESEYKIIPWSGDCLEPNAKIAIVDDDLGWMVRLAGKAVFVATPRRN